MDTVKDQNSTMITGRRIGLLLPSANIVLEPDFIRLLPEGWSVHTTRMYLPVTDVAHEERMLDEFTLPAAKCIADVKPHAVVFGCTSAGSLRGIDYENSLMEQIESITSAPAVSVMQTVRETLKTSSAKRLVVVTPYIDSVNKRIRSNLESDGFEVLKIAGLGIEVSFELGNVAGNVIVSFVEKTMIGQDPDAIFISCTNFPALSVLPILQEKFAVPIVTSNGAAIQKAIQAAAENHLN